ncbi:hypothetical protein D3C80_1619960 [compost metagenome]
MAVASSPAGEQAISRSIETKAEIAKQSASALPFIIKTSFIVAIVAGGGYLLYRAWSDRFKKKDEISTYPKSNLTTAQAETRAKAIKSAVTFFSTDLATIKEAVANVNYNGMIRIYNAFGRTDEFFGKDKDLFEFLADELSASELAEIRFLIPGFF